MFSRVAKRVRRQSMQVEAPAPELPLGPPREVVDCAPDLLRWCNLETPFPSVAYGGYIKYYRTRDSTKIGHSPNYSPGFTNFSSSPSSPKVAATPLFHSRLRSIQPSISPRDVKPMTPEPRMPRKAIRYSFSQVASEKVPILSRWKRATYILTPDITFDPPSNTTALDLMVRPSLDTSRSSSSNRSTPRSSPDSISFSQITHRSSDTPQTPTTTYTNDDDADIFPVGSKKKRFNGIELTLPRPDSGLSFWTAKSEFSEQYT